VHALCLLDAGLCAVKENLMSRTSIEMIDNEPCVMYCEFLSSIYAEISSFSSSVRYTPEQLTTSKTSSRRSLHVRQPYSDVLVVCGLNPLLQKAVAFRIIDIQM
jgi:hypothetical protein